MPPGVARLLLACLALPLLLAGCWDRMEIEDQGMVIELGIDRGQRAKYLVTASLALVQGEGPARTGQRPRLMQREILTAEAGTITKALHILNGGTARHLEFKHLRAITVGESVARDGLEPLIIELTRNPRVRGTAALIVARGRAFEIISANAPPAEVNPAKVVEGVLLQAKRLHLSPPTRLHHFLARIATAGIDPMVAAAAVNEWVKTTDPDLPRGDLESALPGDLARGGGNPVEHVGTAVFHRDHLRGFLNVDETQMLLALRGEMGKAYITFADPDHPDQPVTMRFFQENLPKYTATYQNGRPVVHVRLLFEAELVAIPGGTNYARPEARRRLERAAERFAEGTMEEVLRKLIAWEADPVGFGLLYRGRAATLEAWDAYDWRRHVKDLSVDVESVMRVRRYGLFSGGARVDGGE